MARQCFRVALQIGKDQPTIGVRLSKVWPERDCPVMACQRFRVALQGAQPDAEIAMGTRIVLAQPKRFADQLNALHRSGGLQGEQPGQVQHIKVVWLPAQDFMVYRFGFGKHPPLMQHASALNLVLREVDHLLHSAPTQAPACPPSEASSASPPSVKT